MTQAASIENGIFQSRAVAHARPLAGTRKPSKPCHSERSEESRSDLFVLASARTRARSFAALRMTARFHSRECVQRKLQAGLL